MTPESEREHRALRDAMKAIVDAAPVREVRRAERAAGEFRLELECGHVGRFFELRLTLRCHECAGQASPTRWPKE